MRILIFILAITCPIIISAQEAQLSETVNYQNAVKNGTRSRDGKPGSLYWQNHTDYDITVRLDTISKRIHGKESVVYFNESPDTLSNIVLRLYQDLFKKGAIRDREIHSRNIHEGVIIDTIIINGSGISLKSQHNKKNGTNLSIHLDEPLPSNSKLNLYCEWSYKIPLEPEFRRTGYYKDNAWFIGYFYPQIAVYDDIEFFSDMKGWDYMLFYKGVQEFYNDFNNYNVKIEVPEGFFVWATGNLENPKEVYSKSILESLEEASTTDKVVEIFSGDDLNEELLVGNVWQFKASGVPDFAFGTAPNYIWEGTSVLIGDRRIFVDVAYHPESKLYSQAIEIAKNTVKYASEVFPGIHYPYSHSTTFNGNHTNGMEFPMIANNPDTRNTTYLTLVTSHEITHNYIPFMMGFNEKRYIFMDEGLNFYISKRFLTDEYGIDFYTDLFGSSRDRGIYGVYDSFFASTQDNASLYNAYAHSDLSNLKYQYLTKPLVPFILITEMIGEDAFLSALKEFVSRWKGKHPTPFDLFYTMNDVLKENYNWFWNAWFMDFGYPDLGIEMQDNQVIVKRVGERALPVPVNLNIVYKDGTSTTISQSMNIWKNGEKQITIEIENLKNVKSISIDENSAPDINHGNNYIEIN